jgi:hypothetical protein
MVQGATISPITPSWTTFSNGVAVIADTFFSALSPAALAITSLGVPEGFAGSSYTSTNSLYSTQLTSIGGVGPFTWSVSAGTLPAGLSLSAGGLLTGTPTTAAAATSVTFKITDSTSAFATATLPMTVASTAFSGTVGTCTGAALEGTQYLPYGGCSLSATGGTSPYTYQWIVSLSYASLPPGLILSSSGSIAGTNYGQGAYNTEFQVADAAGTLSVLTITFPLAGDNTFGGCSLFPTDSIFHRKINALPVDTSPAAPIDPIYAPAPITPFFGNDADPYPDGIPILRVPYNQPLEPITATTYQSYFTSGPWPWYTPIEGTQNSTNAYTYISDGHTSIVQMAGGGQPCQLWEGYTSQFIGTPDTNGPWALGSNAYWSNLGTTGAGAYQMLPQDNGSTDAAGLPVAPLLLNYDEVAAGLVQHPTRFTLNHTLAYHVWPATAQAGLGVCTGGYEDTNRLLDQTKPPTACSHTSPMGEIYRLKSSVPNPSCAATSPQSAVIIQGFRDYGIIVSDNGRSGGVIGTPDSRWNKSDLLCLEQLNLTEFEPVLVGQLIVPPATAQSPTTKAAQPVLTAITVAPVNPTLPTYTGTLNFAATCYYNDGSVDSCVVAGAPGWSSGNSLVATVNSSTGAATAGSVIGTATITATAAGVSGIFGTTQVSTFAVPTSSAQGMKLNGVQWK